MLRNLGEFMVTCMQFLCEFSRQQDLGITHWGIHLLGGALSFTFSLQREYSAVYGLVGVHVLWVLVPSFGIRIGV